jgi:Alpha-L-arabinofuranosidase C-terminus.
MYANRDIAYLVDTDVQCDTFDVPHKKTGRLADKLDLSNLPVLDVVSCVNENRDTLTLFVVNRSMDDIQTQVDISGFDAEGYVRLWELSGSDIDEINDVFNPENIIPKFRDINVSTESLNETFKAHSVYILELKGVK